MTPEHLFLASNSVTLKIFLLLGIDFVTEIILLVACTCYFLLVVRYFFSSIVIFCLLIITFCSLLANVCSLLFTVYLLYSDQFYRGAIFLCYHQFENMIIVRNYFVFSLFYCKMRYPHEFMTFFHRFSEALYLVLSDLVSKSFIRTKKLNIQSTWVFYEMYISQAIIVFFLPLIIEDNA